MNGSGRNTDRRRDRRRAIPEPGRNRCDVTTDLVAGIYCPKLERTTTRKQYGDERSPDLFFCLPPPMSIELTVARNDEPDLRGRERKSGSKRPFCWGVPVAHGLGAVQTPRWPPALSTSEYRKPLAMGYSKARVSEATTWIRDRV